MLRHRWLHHGLKSCFLACGAPITRRRVNWVNWRHERVLARPAVDRPYRAVGYPVVPALYIVGAARILAVRCSYRTATTWPGLIIVLLGVPVYFAWKPKR
jgi:hypothetical protein